MHSDTIQAGRERREAIFVAAAAVLAVALASLPLFGEGNMHVADDIWYHMLRIENIRAGLEAGQFPVRMGTNYLNHYGYGSNLCYPELFLYIPAVLRLLGMSVTGSYKAFIILTNAGAFAAMYYAAKYLTGQRLVGLAAAVLLLLSPYHLANIYLRGALGEVQTYMFYPLVAVGLYQLVYEDFDKPWVLGLGFWGLMYSHSISLVLGLLASVGICLVHFKRVFLNARKVRRVFATAGVTLAASCSFWLPFMEQLLSGNLKFDTPWTYVSWQGVSWQRLFSVQQDRYNFGLPFLALSAAALVMLIVWRRKIRGAGEKDAEAAEKTGLARKGIFCLVSGAALLFCATQYFPWAVVEPVLNNIQFPWRFYALASVFLALGIGAAVYAAGRKKRIFLYGGVLLVCAVAVGGAGLYLRRNPVDYVDLPYDGGYSNPDGTFEIIQREWLPAQVDFDSLRGERQVRTEEGESVPFQTDARGFITFEADGEHTSYLVPFIWYKGYTAVLMTANGEKELEATADEATGLVRVSLGAGEAGTVRCGYGGTALQRISDIAEGITILALAGGLLVNWHKNNRRKADRRIENHESMDETGRGAVSEI